MKKFLLSVLLMLSIGFANQSRAQCNGASVAITNFTVIPVANLVLYSFTWQFVQGNASIEVFFMCNGTVVGSLPCIPRLKDQAPGPHVVSGSFAANCSGTFRMEIGVWTNPHCGGNYCIADFREISNIPLPVSFKSFSAARNKAYVTVKWETATESNNLGFQIQRLAGNGSSWQDVSFVPSQAAGGNSTFNLSYSYNDFNNNKGITQYRLRQTDIDSRYKFSEIRAVKGEGQLGKTIVYPNPTNDGKINVVFDEVASARQVTLTDMSGRIIRQWKAVDNNNIQIENLNPGMYFLRIVIPETGEQGVEKIVVNNR